MSAIRFSRDKDGFFKTLRQRTQAYFKENQIQQTGNAELYSKTVILLLVFVFAYAYLVFFTPSVAVSAGLCMLLGVNLAVIGFNVMHDGAHGSYSGNKVINKCMAYTLNFMGGNASLWNKKHNVNHHTYTNVEGMDEDIDVQPFMRMHAGQKKLWVHRFQHIYGLLLYGLTYMSWIFYVDFAKYFSGKLTEEVKSTRKKLGQHFDFWLSKAVHISVFFLIPFWQVGVIPTLLGYLLMAFVTGLVIALVFQLAHVVENTQFFDLPKEEGKTLSVENSWAQHQVRTTSNFATDNRWVNWLLGGLNFQVEHHLFPRISHVHYPKLNLIVRTTCQEYGVPYQEYPSMFSAVRSHLRQLRSMGNM